MIFIEIKVVFSKVSNDVSEMESKTAYGSVEYQAVVRSDKLNVYSATCI